MPDLEIEFSKFDIIAIIIPGSLILIGIMTFFPNSLYKKLYEIFVTEGAYFFILVLAFVIFSFIFGKIMSELSFWVIERLFIIQKDSKKKRKFKLRYASYNLLLTKKEHEEFNRFKRYRKPFETHLRDEIIKTYEKFFDVKLDKATYFPLLYTFIKENCSECASRLATNSALYHFFRSLTLTFSTVSIAIGILHAWLKNCLWLYIVAPVASIIVAFVCFNSYLRYCKIFSSDPLKSFYLFHYLDKKKKDKKKKEK